MDVTFGELVDALRPAPSSDSPFQLGEWYLIRTVTMIDAGRLTWIGEHELVLEDAVWIADTGRFHDCLKDPDVVKEAEPFQDKCIIGRHAIIDATTWHALRISQR